MLYICSVCGNNVPPQALYARSWAVIDGRESTNTNKLSTVFNSGIAMYLCTCIARRIRKTLSYASLGGSRFKASKTVSDSSGIRSSALTSKHVSKLDQVCLIYNHLKWKIWEDFREP